MYNDYLNIDETEFNKLDNISRLKFLMSKYKKGDPVIVKMNSTRHDELKNGVIFGFYRSNLHPPERCLKLDPPSLSDLIIPTVNIFIEFLDGDKYFIDHYYPLWVYPDVVEIRENKLNQLGI